MNNNSVLNTSLANARNAMLQQCSQVPDVIFSHETALVLHMLELPVSHPAKPQAVVRTAADRDFRCPDVAFHTWQGLRDDDTEVTAGVRCLQPHAVLMMLAKRYDEIQLCLAMETMLRFRMITLGQISDCMLRKFHGKRKFERAMRLIQQGGDSMQEDRLQLELNRRGVPQFVRNHTVSDLRYESGVGMTLDLAITDVQIGVEYQGDQHRTDQRQFQRDAYKRNLLQGAGWTLYEVTAADMRSSARLDALAQSMLATVAARRGLALPFRRLTPQQLADRRRKLWRQGA